MTVQDAPDWQRVITIKSGGGLTDAPDWERIVTGPGGTPPVVTVTSGSFASPLLNAGYCGASLYPASQQDTFSGPTGNVSVNTFVALASTTINFVWININAGETVTPNENYICVYDQGQATAATYTLLGATAAGACDSPFAHSPMFKIPLAAGVPIIEGESYAFGLIMNTTGSAPSFTGSQVSNSSVFNPVGLTYPMCVTSPTTHTTPPATIPWSTAVLASRTYMIFGSNA
jgi:hypothetical protein